MRNRITPIIAAAILVTGLQAQDTATLETQKDRVSYALGYSLGSNLKREGIDLDPQVFARAIEDLLNDRPTAMTEEEARTTWQQYQQELFQKKEQERAAKAAENKSAGAAWLATNKEKEGVVQLESGLQYKVIKEGTGESPTANDTVQVHYRGTLIDGTEFDSSISRGQPATFNPTRVIKGWTEALQLMKEGSKWELYIPSDLAYGDAGQGAQILPGSTLIFEVELLKVNKPQPITSDIIKVPSREEMERGAQIETIKADELKRIEEEARKAQEASGAK